MSRLCLALVCGVALAWNLGCGPTPPNGPAPAAPVKGTVKLDGNPVPAGEIHFGRIGIPPRVLTIKDGAFTGEAPIGKNQVEVYIYVEGPPSEKYKGERTKKNIAPEKYWGPKTTLEATVDAGGANEFKFDLTTPK
jgi:hypothetical protein